MQRGPNSNLPIRMMNVFKDLMKIIFGLMSSLSCLVLLGVCLGGSVCNAGELGGEPDLVHARQRARHQERTECDQSSYQ